MNILLGEENVRDIDERYTVLELDTIKIRGREEPVKAFCLVDNLPIGEMLTLSQQVDLHANLIKNYRLKNWNFCEQAIEHLHGKWNGDLNSFYDELTKRIAKFREQDPGDDWDAVIDRSGAGVAA